MAFELDSGVFLWSRAALEGDVEAPETEKRGDRHGIFVAGCAIESFIRRLWRWLIDWAWRSDWRSDCGLLEYMTAPASLTKDKGCKVSGVGNAVSPTPFRVVSVGGHSDWLAVNDAEREGSNCPCRPSGDTVSTVGPVEICSAWSRPTYEQKSVFASGKSFEHKHLSLELGLWLVSNKVGTRDERLVARTSVGLL